MVKPKLISNIEDFNNTIIHNDKYYIIQFSSYEYNEDCFRMNSLLDIDQSWIENYNGKVIWCKIYTDVLYANNNQELQQKFSQIYKLPTFFLLKGPVVIEYFSGGLKDELIHFINKNINN